MQELERDLDPPEPVRYDMVKIKNYWIVVEWENGQREVVDVPKNIPEVEALISEVEIEANRDILENQAQKYGDPDGDY